MPGVLHRLDRRPDPGELSLNEVGFDWCAVDLEPLQQGVDVRRHVGPDP